MKPTAGRGWARAGFWFGILTSISGNVAHSYISPHPHVGAIVSSAFWPCALLISLEVIARVDWPRGYWWGATRFGGLTTVAVIAAVVSYLHMSALLTFYGESGLTAAIGPCAPDGLLVVCSAALLAISDNVRRNNNRPIEPKNLPAIGIVEDAA